MVGVVGGLANTGRAGAGLASNVGGAVSNPDGILEKSKVGQSVGDIFASTGSTAVDIAKNGRTDILVNSSKVAGGFGGVISLWGAVNDWGTINEALNRKDEKTGMELGLSNVKLSDTISLIGNTIGAIGGGLALVFAGALAAGTAPVWVPAAIVIAGATSLALGATSLYAGSNYGDLTVTQFSDNIKEFFKQDFSQKFTDYVTEKFPNYAENLTNAREGFEQFIDAIIKKITDSNTYDPTPFIEEMLQPVVDLAKWLDEHGRNIEDGIGNFIDDIFEGIKNFANAIKDIYNQITDFDIINWLSDTFSSWFGIDRSGTYFIYDPLILDLNGDGIQTTAIDRNKVSNNAYFDFDNDGRLSVVNDELFLMAG